MNNPFNPKFLFSIFFLLLCISTFASLLNAQDFNVPDRSPTEEEVIVEISSNLSIMNTLLTASKTGLVASWLMSNWYILILSIIGLARTIIAFTPSKRDNRFWNLYLNRPLRFIMSLLSLSKPSNTVYK